MWDGLFILLVLSAVMILASFLAGSLPLSLSLTNRQMRLISSLGTGVLVGTSLIVIIPEGIETLYSAGRPAHSHSRREISLSSRTIHGVSYAQLPFSDSEASPFDDLFGLANPFEHSRSEQQSDLLNDIVVVRRDEESERKPDPPAEPPSAEAPEEAGTREPHAYVGVSLIMGFILMYLIDKVPKHASTSPDSAQPLQISLRSLGRGVHRPDSPTAMLNDDDPLHEGNSSQAEGLHQSFSTTTGLVIHGLADGIALGASNTTDNHRLGFVIFVALMIHKAPAAFGLTSVLLKQGLSKKTARAHLLVFSCAAPVGAIVTFLIINMLGRFWTTSDSDRYFATGIILLFSAGTFLYVAMHTMQDDGGQHGGPAMNGIGEGHMYERYGNASAPKKDGPTMTDTMIAVVGMLIPLVTQVNHAH